MANFNPYAGYPQQYPQYNGYQQYPPYQQYQQNGQQMQGVLQNPQQPQGQAQQMLPTQMSGASQQMQNGGFYCVRSFEEAQNFPVAPGNFVTFKIENQPYMVEKSKGFSQLENPKIKVFELREVDGETPTQVQTQEQTQVPEKKEDYALKSDFLDAISDFEDLRKQIKNLENQIKNLRKQNKSNPTNQKNGAVEEKESGAE